MKRKSRPESQPQSNSTLLKLHGLTLIVSIIGAGLILRVFGDSIMPGLALILFGGSVLFLIHLYSYHFYMAREQKRERAYFEALRLQDDDAEPTEADVRRQTLLSVKHRIAAQHNEKSL